MEVAADTKQIPTYFPTSTPIVDGLQPLPPRTRLRFGAGEYFFLSGALILGLIGLPVFRRMTEALSSQGVIPASLIACLMIPGAGLAAAVAVHEAGHLVAAWLAGLRPAPTVPSAPGFAMSGSGLRPYCRGLLRIGAWTLESGRLDHLPRRLSLAVLGGPLASFLLPLTAAVYVAVARPSHLAVFCVQAFSAMSVLLGIAEALPDMGRGATSDGARLLMLLRQDAFADRWLALVRLQLAWDGDECLRDWDEATVSGLMTIDDDSRDAVAARWIAYWWATERQDITSAAKYLEESLAAPTGSSDWLRDRLFLEAAVFQAWFREDLEKAGMWAARIRHRKLTYDQECRLAIALLWANGRLFEAWEKLGQMLTRFREMPACSARDFAVASCLEWKRQMESRMLTRAWRALYSTTQDVDGSTPQNVQVGSTEPATLPN
jgi:hypothetical protein